MTNPNELPQAPAAPGNAAVSRNGTLSDRVRSLRLAERTTQGTQRGAVIPWTLCAILLLTTLAFGYYAYRTTPEETSSPETEKLKQLLAATGANPGSAEDLEKIKKILAASHESGSASRDVASSGEVVLESKGYITPVHQILVSPKVSGMLKWVDPRLEEGAYFQENEVLAKIEKDEYQAEYDKALGQLHAAKERLSELEKYRPDEIRQAQLEMAEYEANSKQLKLALDRTQKLVGTNSVAAQDYEQAKSSYDSMERRVERLRVAVQLLEHGPRDAKIGAAKAEVEQAQADMNRAALHKNWCEVRAPVSGTILTKKAEMGNLVNPSAFSNGLAASLCEMADLSKIEVDLAVQERDFAKVIVPQGGAYQICTVMPEAFQRDDNFLKVHPTGYEGYVARVMPIADRAKGAITVRVRVRVTKEEAGVYLKPDMGVVVAFKSKTTKQVEPD